MTQRTSALPLAVEAPRYYNLSGGLCRLLPFRGGRFFVGGRLYFGGRFLASGRFLFGGRFFVSGRFFLQGSILLRGRRFLRRDDCGGQELRPAPVALDRQVDAVPRILPGQDPLFVGKIVINVDETRAPPPAPGEGRSQPDSLLR